MRPINCLPMSNLFHRVLVYSSKDCDEERTTIDFFTISFSDIKKISFY